MTSLVVTNIGTLVTNDPGLGEGRLGVRRDAAIAFTDGQVAWVGDSATAPAADHGIDLGGRALLPGFVESHSHLVFAGERAEEFAARMTGTPTPRAESARRSRPPEPPMRGSSKAMCGGC